MKVAVMKVAVMKVYKQSLSIYQLQYVLLIFNFGFASPGIVYILFKGTDQAGTFMSSKCVVYYADYRSGHQSSKIQVVP